MDRNKFNLCKCDFCGQDKYQILFKDMVDTYINIAGKFNVVRCQNCKLIYLNPRVNPKFIREYYSESYGPYQQENPLILRIKYFLWRIEKNMIQKYMGSKGKILEVGCANGDFLFFLKKAGYSVFGIEMDEDSAARADERLGGGGVGGVNLGTFEDFDFQGRKFDLIIMTFVLEHLPSLSFAFEKLHSIVATGGYLMLSVPNYDSWDRIIFGRYWHCLDVPRHYFIFTDSIMKQYAQKFDFKIIRIRHSFVPNDWIGGVGRFLRNKNLIRLADFFVIKNRLVSAAFLPISILAYLFRKSSRVTYILQAN